MLTSYMLGTNVWNQNAVKGSFTKDVRTRGGGGCMAYADAGGRGEGGVFAAADVLF